MNRYIEIMQAMAEAVIKASAVVYKDYLSYLESGEIDYKNKPSDGLPDYVVETDRKSEEIIKSYLACFDPSIPFIGEEQGGTAGGQKFFLVDPLDGTSNFLARKKYFAICAAYVEDRAVKAAVIADPCSQSLLKSALSSGVFYNASGKDRKLSPCNDDAVDMARYQLECEMPIKGYEDMVDTRSLGMVHPMRFISPIMNHVSGFRKSGSTALDVFNLALGQRSIVVSSNLAPHDTAAAVLIAQEMGLGASEFDGSPIRFDSDTLIVAPKAIHKRVLDLLK